MSKWTFGGQFSKEDAQKIKREQMRVFYNKQYWKTANAKGYILQGVVHVTEGSVEQGETLVFVK